jgi:hypothetical protein
MRFKSKGETFVQKEEKLGNTAGTGVSMNFSKRFAKDEKDDYAK